jgi:transposase-like protein
MSNVHKSHPDSFKLKVASAAIAGENTIRDIANKYSIHPSQVMLWKGHLEELVKSHGINGKKAATKKDEEQLQDHLKLIGKLTCENDFLKKKLGY